MKFTVANLSPTNYYIGTTLCTNTTYDVHLAELGWFGNSTEVGKGNSGTTTHQVGLKNPNAWGLYDCHGNVYEWCLDWNGTRTALPETDPQGPTSNKDNYRVIRGGCRIETAVSCRSARRYREKPDSRQNSRGFRLVCPFNK